MSSSQFSQSQEKNRLQQVRKPLQPDLPEAGLAERLPAETIELARQRPQALNAPQVHALQQHMGNRAVGGMVGAHLTRAGSIQRQAGVLQREGEDPLTPTQVNLAIQYYHQRSTQYTSAIIQQIQGGVGVPTTGVVDAAMVQAVARYQLVNSPLKVDGMAGPRTLPALFPSGLAEQAAIEEYAAAARTVINDDWAGKTPDERAQAILDRVNERLTAAGVPVVGKVVHAMDPNTYGQFDFTIWSIEINLGLVQNTTLTEAQAADLADTMYHEARHGEQWYRMAQLLAGQNKTAAEIATQMAIPNNIALSAEAAPLAPGSMEALIADGWFQSVYGTGRAHREHALGEEGTDEQYRNLPEESDAWRVGTAVTDAYRAGAGAEAGEGEATVLEMEPLEIEGTP
jgi:hypothetical protein